MAKAKKEPAPREVRAHEGYDPEFVRDVSVEVYKLRLEDANGPGAAERMLAADKRGEIDTGGKIIKTKLDLRGRASAYDPLTRAYFVALKIPKPRG